MTTGEGGRRIRLGHTKPLSSYNKSLHSTYLFLDEEDRKVYGYIQEANLDTGSLPELIRWLIDGYSRLLYLEHLHRVSENKRKERKEKKEEKREKGKRKRKERGEKP